MAEPDTGAATGTNPHMSNVSVGSPILRYGPTMLIVARIWTVFMLLVAVSIPFAWALGWL